MADLLSPKASPGGTQKVGTRRANKVPLIIFGIMVFGFLVITAMVAVKRAEQQNEPAEGEVKTARSATAAAKEFASGVTEGMIPAAKPVASPEPNKAEAELPPPSGTAAAGVPVATAGADLDLPPPPPTSEVDEQIAEAIQRLKMRRVENFQQALSAPASHQTSGYKGGDSTAPADRDAQLAQLADVRRQLQEVSGAAEDPTAVYKKRLAEVQSMIASNDATGASVGFDGEESGASNMARNDIRQFAGTEDRWKLGNRVQIPASIYAIQPGWVIPMILVSKINSDLPGQITAQVAENVYDSATGKHLLIPQGTKSIGVYNADIIYAQERVLSAFQRLNFPDGRWLDIDAMNGADGEGAAGLEDEVDHHFFRVFGSAALTSIFTAGVEISQPAEAATTSRRASDALSEALGQQLGNAMTQMISKNLNVAPTLKIRPGDRFNVIVNKDLIFPGPYKSFEYRTAGVR